MEIQNQTEATNEALYKQVSMRIDQWLAIHKDETFDLDLICRQLEITSSEGRLNAASKLFYEVKHGKLEKNNRIYRYILNNKAVIDWLNAPDEPVLDIHWPYGIEDETHFGFDGNVYISPGDIIVNAGFTNSGKTCFAVNFLWMNMDAFPCILMGNEYTPAKFKQIAKRMQELGDPLKDGKPKFELIERHSAWKDIIEPDGINIIDWINLPDKFWELGTVIEGIKSKLRNGIALICIQKDSNKEMGMGGNWGAHLTSLYITMDYGKLFGRMTVMKAKAYNGHNPNHEMYKFQIVNFGTRFHDIHKIKPCPKCKGYPKPECVECLGSGYVTVEDHR